MTTPDAPATQPPHPRRAERLAAAGFAVLFGIAVALCVIGYQFGRSNHTIYLLDALRSTRPELLANDWFTTQTLQYHALFGFLTSSLYRFGIVEPAFLLGYLALAATMHLAWYRIVRQLDGGMTAYLVSVLLYYLSAGGFGLGMYQFLQDGAFLPSNVANVAMLCALALWMQRRYAWSGAAFGVAGLFHLNHAVVGVGLWCALVLWERWRPAEQLTPRPIRAWALGSLMAIVPCAANIALALGAKLSRSGAMPLAEFVDLYVRLRHPHHYDPSSWPAALWACFLWPMPLAVWAWLRHRGSPAWTQAARVFALTCGLLLVALLGAGIFYVSESLVQMSLYRFSIFPKLLSCIGVAILLLEARRVRGVVLVGIPLVLVATVAVALALNDGTAEVIRSRPWPCAFFLVLCCLPVLRVVLRERAATDAIAAAALAAAIVLGWGKWTTYLPDDPPEYLAICQWARDPANTPIDAVFLVPPDEHSFRLHAQRAIVVNYKGVPQLSGEMIEWRSRLWDVLDVPTLVEFPIPFGATLAAMGQRYNRLPPAHLKRVAERYSARYVIARPGLAPDLGAKDLFGRGRYVLYDLGN